MSRSPLPPPVAADLLRRWAEPHRHYHGVSHLDAGLAVLESLGAGQLELIAYWCHDAVHTNTSPEDELASAELARTLLSPYLTGGEIDEVCRLVLVTITHRTEAHDHRGARVADADLHGLGGPWDRYQANVRAIRAEVPDMLPVEWLARRREFGERLLARENIFATLLARSRWEAAARVNISRELVHSFL